MKLFFFFSPQAVPLSLSACATITEKFSASKDGKKKEGKGKAASKDVVWDSQDSLISPIESEVSASQPGPSGGPDYDDEVLVAFKDICAGILNANMSTLDFLGGFLLLASLGAPSRDFSAPKGAFDWLSRGLVRGG